MVEDGRSGGGEFTLISASGSNDLNVLINAALNRDGRGRCGAEGTFLNGLPSTTDSSFSSSFLFMGSGGLGGIATVRFCRISRA